MKKTGKCRSCGCEYEILYRNGIKVSNFCVKCRNSVPKSIISSVSSMQVGKYKELVNIKKTKEEKCVICKKSGNDLAHLLPKSVWPEHYTNELNLEIMCRSCHNKYDNDIEFRRKQTHLYVKICKYDAYGAYKYFNGKA